MIQRLIGFLKRRPMASAIGALAGGAFAAWLLFGFFGVQTLFIDDVVDEANPFTAQAGPSGLAIDETTQELADAMNDAMKEEGKTGDDKVSDDMPDAEITTLVRGEFISRAHHTEGIAKVITDGDQRFLRFEGFLTDNGPDLNVYLATGAADGSPGDFVDLGDLKGNIGDQNYEIGPGVDLDLYNTVFIWCVRFSVGFGAADLS